MSSILKALKKLETEKNIHKPEVVRIPPQTTSLSAAAPLRYGIAAMLLLACGFGASRYYNLSSGEKTVSPPRPAVPKAEPAAPSSSQDVPAVRLTGERIIPAPEERPADNGSLRSAISHSHDGSRKKISSAGPATAGPSPVKANKQSAMPTPPPVAAPAVQPEHGHGLSDERKQADTRPLLKVEGIAFMDGADSVAMINGVQASKSTVVEGAKVEAVMRDRVVFSFMGERFEVLLGRSNRP